MADRLNGYRILILETREEAQFSRLLAEQGADVPVAAILAQQVYTTNWNVINGDLHLSNQQWVNNSTTTIQSADLECDQYDQTGADLAQKHVQLTDQTGGAVKPGTTESFGDLDLGAAVTGLTKVNCGIVGVTPATQ